MSGMKTATRALMMLAAMWTALGAVGCGDDGLTRVTRGELVVEAGGGDNGLFVDFEPVAPGFRRDALNDIIIKNGDLGELTITSIDVVTDVTGYIKVKTTIPPAPIKLTSEETLPIKFELAIPPPVQDPDPLTCPAPTGALPPGIDASRYCGQVTIKSGAPDNKTIQVFFQVSSSSGSLKVNPTVLSFDNPQVGRAITKQLTLTNESTNGQLVVEKITKRDFPGGTEDDFQITGFPFPVTLTPGDSVNYDITYTPQSNGEISGKFVVESDDPANPQVTVTVQTGSGNAAQILVEPTALIFPAAAPGSPEDKEITITNTGNGAALTINSFLLLGSGVRDAYTVGTGTGADFTALPNNTVQTIGRQNSKVYTVRYTPPQDGTVVGTLRIISNASNVPNGEVNVTLSGNEASPDALIAPANIVFDVAPGETDERQFAVRNEGLADLDITGVSFSGTISDDEFSITPNPAGVTVGPGEIASFTLTYARQANDVGLDQGALTLRTNNPVNGGDLLVNVRNNNQDNAFSPVARISQNPMGTVTLGTSVTLDGTGSTPESGDLAFHLWTLIERPAGAEADLSNINADTVTITPDVAGTYRVQLTVGNSLSLEGSAVQEFVVTD